MHYKLTFGRNSQLIPALILPAFILLIPLVLFLEFVDPLLPSSEWTSIIVSVVYMSLVLFFTLRWVKAITAPVEITITGDEVQFLFPKKNIFHRTDFTISFQHIINIGEDSDKGFDFLYFETKLKEYKKFHITAANGDSQFAEFREHVLSRGELFNTSVPAANRITHKTIYQKWPMKMLAVFLILFLIAFPIVSLYTGTTWLNNLRYWVMVVMGIPIVAKVYSQNFIKQ
jgi:hypothetical protein